MVQSLCSGTLLRQRYLIQQVLGQGGFGRTYLALDQERFNEACVIKEFVVTYEDRHLVQKAKSLFLREANILYRVEHPQIPRFTASFEDADHLFLVQSHVPGQTYGDRLRQRLAQGQLFAEAEVTHLLTHLLPVLDYLHQREIVHRDISPDNIIAAETGLPVLIDFGAVKAAASPRSQMTPNTRVGKRGYAPPEQLQTGKVNPTSDLYALAATCMVLLTGRKPSQLLDQRLNWKPAAFSQLSPPLAQLFQRMLAIHPKQRFPSAQAVMVALNPLLEGSQAPAELLELTTNLWSPSHMPLAKLSVPARDPARDPAGSPLASYGSPEPRLFAGRNSPALPGFLPPAHLRAENEGFRPRLRPRQGQGRSQQPWVVQAILLLLLLGGGGWTLPQLWQRLNAQTDNSSDVWLAGVKMNSAEVSRLQDGQTQPLSNFALKESAATALDAATSLRSLPTQRLQVAAGQATKAQGEIASQSLQPYRFKAKRGEVVTITLEGVGVVMNIAQAPAVATATASEPQTNLSPLNGSAYQTRAWTGQIAEDGDYVIQVSGTGTYGLEVRIAPHPTL